MPFPTKDYPSPQEIDRWKREDNYYRTYNADLTFADDTTDRGKFRLAEFFENDAKKAKILDTALHISSIAIDAGADFLFGKPVKIQVDGDGFDETAKRIEAFRKRVKFDTKLKESATLFQAVGHTQFKLYSEMGEDGKIVACMEEVAYDNWSPNWAKVPNGEESKDVRIVSYLNDGEPIPKKYIYIENYYVQKDDKGQLHAFCHKSLWQDKSGQLGDPVALSTLGIEVGDGANKDPANQLAMIETTKLSKLPIVTMDMRKTIKERFGQSILKKAEPIIHQINDRLTQLSIQFLKHLNAKLQIPDGCVVRDSEGNVKSVNWEVIIARAGDPDAKYITNDNPLIEECFTFLEKLIRAFAKLTKRPDSFFIEDEKGGVETAETLRTRLMNFLREIDNYVFKYDPGVEQIIRLMLKIEEDKNADTVPLKITFDPGLPKEWQADVAVWGQAKSEGIASLRTAVSRFQGIEGDELDTELEEIQGDEEKMMQSQLDLKVAQPPPDPNAPKV